ncbi:MAG TPA: hypothetical protein GX706_02025 [Candidatus Moranbacteria bacterium]|nr:hypothetical protein [Candidatus Moranbacteria bacterium]
MNISTISSRIILVSFSNNFVSLPQDIQEKVDAYWSWLMANGKSYYRGEVFTATNKTVVGNAIAVSVDKTDYAHYLYCQDVCSLGDKDVGIVHAVSLVETADEYFVFGKMGHQTSRAGMHQLCGGGIDSSDLRGDHFDLNHNIGRELLEELGINIADNSRVKQLEATYLYERGISKILVVYNLLLKEKKDDFLKKYNRFADQLMAAGELSEFGEIIFLKKEKNEIQDFFSQDKIKFDEYMFPLFSFIIKEEL